jgi:flagellar biosynthesis protein FliR
MAFETVTRVTECLEVLFNIIGFFINAFFVYLLLKHNVMHNNLRILMVSYTNVRLNKRYCKTDKLKNGFALFIVDNKMEY